jgi:hypothetical protein
MCISHFLLRVTHPENPILLDFRRTVQIMNALIT